MELLDEMPGRSSATEPADEPADTAQRLSLLGHLAALPPRRRAAVFLRFYFDLSVEETAEILGCSTGTVKSLTSRGLDTLRSRVASLSTSDLGDPS
jgi:RNA polymerase sigma factor (sigma-70 family)